ncbi:hypothetical protein [Radiobacillus deserti]|uniref:Uncharacterized protein n=1 Tax=Radiobacillus deserti TaxID=2594883 RepID=A0A516KKR5_9BACI|nr:hypothetical protein [Radiobacillus deserti]QDP41975.1 hypothetical protein FN924_18455 [Radiobacillus deserti]
MQMTIIERCKRKEILHSLELEEHSYNYWLPILVRDHKEFVEELFSGISNNSFDRIMHFFATRFNNQELENRAVAKAIYAKLGWNSDYYDVINSFYTTFVGSLVAYSESENATSFKEIHEALKNDNTLKKIIQNWKCSLFSFGDKTNLKIAMCGELKDIGKEKYAKKVLEEGNLQRIILEKYIFDSSNNKDLSEKILEFSSLCHCLANFMPCPEPPFNQLKGCLNDVKDYFPLMIDKIQEWSEESMIKIKIPEVEIWKDGKKEIKTEIDKLQIISWKEWFSDEENRTTFFLEDYYDIDYEKGRKILKGKPLFKNQKLSHAIPQKKEEVEECISNIITITKRRADSMAKRMICRMKN